MTDLIPVSLTRTTTNSATTVGMIAIVLWSSRAFETTVQPDFSQWTAIVVLGLGPVGLAFFAWDHATKHGSLATLGALSCLAPLMSTLLLITVGRSHASPILIVPALLIIAGAAIATSRSTSKVPITRSIVSNE